MDKEVWIVCTSTDNEGYNFQEFHNDKEAKIYWQQVKDDFKDELYIFPIFIAKCDFIEKYSN